jgi:hypothetical protein
MDTLSIIFNEFTLGTRDAFSVILLSVVILLIGFNKFRAIRKKASQDDDEKFWY